MLRRNTGVLSLTKRITLSVVVTSTILLTLSPITSTANTNFTPNYSPIEIDYPGTNVVFHVGEAYPTFKSDLIDFSDPRGRQIWCRSTDDADCKFDANSPALARSILPPCLDDASTNCIAGLQITPQNGQVKTAKLVKEIGGYTIPADPSKGYIGGRSASVWSIEGSGSAGGPEVRYLIAAQFNASWNKRKLSFEVDKLSVSVFPIVEKPGDFYADRWATDAEREASANSQFRDRPLQFVPKVRQGMSGSDLRDCLVFDDKYCAQHTIFDEGTRVKVDLRLTNELGGWFHGRIKDPLITIQQSTPTSNLVSVDAEAIMIPRLTHVVELNSLDALEDRLFNQTFWGGAVPRELYAGPLADTGDKGFEFVNALREKVGDSAAGSTSTWNFTSISAGSGSACLSDTSKVLGIVSTNATVFESTAPQFTDGQLAYKVSGLHYQKDKKTENLGTYDLVINSEVARCLYGFTRAPISASVSITGGSDQKIATTVVNEKNGWLKLAAYGFTYSEKVLQVKLTQEVEAKPTPAATPTAKPAAAKKTTITCVKGKTTKKVTAVKPKCPTGFKKKA
jgi:hypothetical protein